jgi:hypothetical protein
MLRLCPVSQDGSAMRNVPVRRAARIAHADGFATFMSQEHRRCHRRCNTLQYAAVLRHFVVWFNAGGFMM